MPSAVTNTNRVRRLNANRDQRRFGVALMRRLKLGSRFEAERIEPALKFRFGLTPHSTNHSPMRLRFTIRDLLWLVVFVAILSGLPIDIKMLAQEFVRPERKVF
jgi:hypothetical protein